MLVIYRDRTMMRGQQNIKKECSVYILFGPRRPVVENAQLGIT